MNFSHFRIVTKLMLGFGLLLILLVGVSAFAIVQLQRVTEQMETINQRWLPSVASADGMRLAVTNFRRLQYSHLSATDTSAMDTIEKRMTEAQEQFAAAKSVYDPLPQTAEEVGIYEHFTADWKTYQEQSVEWLALSKSGKKDEARTQIEAKAMSDGFNACDHAMKEISEINLHGSTGADEASRAIANSAYLLILIAAAGSVMAGLIAAILLARSISRPIQTMAAIMRQVAGGDLTARVVVESKDEIGLMGESLNETVSSLHQVISEIREAADQTAASGEELSASAQNISSGAQSQASSVEEISASVQELSRSITQVAKDAIDANQVAQATGSTAEEGAKTVDRSIEGMKAINDSSSHIAKIIGVINQIANQTNLLALNAAIEAASAGEHGLGFAVVADEVRKLAERSSTAAQEIAQLIEESGKRVDDGTTLSHEVGKSLQGILDGISRTKQGMAGISSSTEKQAQTAQEVSTGVEGISAITEENSASAEEMAASAEELSAQAQRLQQLVSRFTLAEKNPAERKTNAKPDQRSSTKPDKTPEPAESRKPTGVNGRTTHAADQRRPAVAEPRRKRLSDDSMVSNNGSGPARKSQRVSVTVSAETNGSAGVGKALYHE
ncbi:methyl-accepting chemotaxis protein [Planctomycetota bacterium]|nr:methyl-accepting chemotaxis protein [Planctomycetota bacterium]